MKKILMGTLGMAMAVSSFATEAKQVSIPLTATVELGDVVVTTGIKVAGDLAFGTLNPSLQPGGNPDAAAERKSLKVTKVENGVETPLNIGDYGYKAISNNWTWDEAVSQGYVNKTNALDEIYDVFHSGDSPTGEEIGDRNNDQFPYALRTQAEGDTINVWFSGDVKSELQGKVYQAKADIYVALPEVYENK